MTEDKVHGPLLTNFLLRAYRIERIEDYSKHRKRDQFKPSTFFIKIALVFLYIS